MARIIFVYGLVAGLVVITGIIGTTLVNGDEPHGSMWLGYLIMLVALSSILLGMKQHRDQALGGVIKFWPAFGIGVGISVIAAVAYVLVWEAYLAMTDYAFMGQYVDATLRAKREAGVSGAEYAALERQLLQMAEQYKNPLFRMPMTFVEIFPVGLLVSLVSAALVRNPRFLPARAPAAAPPSQA